MEYTVLTIAPIILFPFSAFVINAFFGRKLYRHGDWLSVIAIFLSFIWCSFIFKDFYSSQLGHEYYIHKVFSWFDLSYEGTKANFEMGFFIDGMTAVMLLMVSGVATLIHLFSTFYMHGEEKYGKFFIFLSLFTSAMLGLVLSDNLISIFIFWELMGFCSYSLIGFYVEKEKAGDASIKAFMTTRVGDVCFLLGILTIYSVLGNVGIVEIYQGIASGAFADKLVLGVPILTFAGFCLFLGTIGKSAQFPLQVWLPDAMMGPTPCSALIHAATMVAAGVYLSLRMFPVMEGGGLNTFIACIGVITAFGAATIALIQTDIKAVLAFSTISQLGYMVLGIGVGAYNASFMHLITHAVFKACLFLSAGSVIHSLHDEHTHGHVQELPRMGGLRKKMPFTFFAMMCCTLAISGVPFFSGFVSKDRILGDALFWGYTQQSSWGMVIPVMGFVTAGLTAFYMFRMIFLAFFGTPRDQAVYDHCHSEHLSFNQNVPLLILSIFTLGIFFCGSLTGSDDVNIPIVKKEWFSNLIQKPDLKLYSKFEKQNLQFKTDISMMTASTNHSQVEERESDHNHHSLLHKIHEVGALISIVIAFFGISFAYLMYVKKLIRPEMFSSFFARWNRALENKYYFDFFYIEVLIKKVLLNFNRLLAWIDLNVLDRYFVDGWAAVCRKVYLGSGWFDMKIIDAIVDLNGFFIRFLNVIFRTFQTGKLQFYFVVLLVVLSGYVCFIKI